jgi:hypothetical protein
MGTTCFQKDGHHSATNTKLKLEYIDAITHVRESNIESIGPIAEVSLKNGGIKQVPISIIKAIAPNVSPIFHIHLKNCS